MDEVRKHKRINPPSAIVLGNAWRKAKEEDPLLEYKMCFREWRKQFVNEYFKKRRNNIS